ncbi:hypothetical protein HDV62DRAFT_217226 [Trichoderma sp. SZMC 28011]
MCVQLSSFLSFVSIGAIHSIKINKHLQLSICPFSGRLPFIFLAKTLPVIILCVASKHVDTALPPRGRTSHLEMQGACQCLTVPPHAAVTVPPLGNGRGVHVSDSDSKIGQTRAFLSFSSWCYVF